MKNWPTKKKLLWVSLVLTVMGFLTTGLTMLKFWCGEGNYVCWDKFDFFGNLTLIFLPVFILSLITFWMREEVFRAWLRFAYWWIPLTILLVLMTKDRSGGFGIPDIVTRESISMIFSTLFLLISLILITYKSFSLRKKG